MLGTLFTANSPFYKKNLVSFISECRQFFKPLYADGGSLYEGGDIYTTSIQSRKAGDNGDYTVANNSSSGQKGEINEGIKCQQVLQRG